MSNRSGPDNDGSNAGREAEPLPVKPQEQLASRAGSITLDHLNYRLADISGSIAQSLQDIARLQNLNAQDVINCSELVAELNGWERLMAELESVVDWLAAKKSPQLKDAEEPQLPVINMAHAPERSERDLLQSFADKERRIRELEDQVNRLKISVDTPSADETPFVNRIILTTNGHENFKFPLTRSIMTIGREMRNEIHIPSRFISRFHARIVSDEQGSIIEDLDSSNGVRVNSRRVRRKQLRSGDLIDIGRTQLKFIDLMDGSFTGEGNA